MGCHRNRPLPSSGSIMTRMPSKRPGRSATPPISRYRGGVADPGCQTRCHAATGVAVKAALGPSALGSQMMWDYRASMEKVPERLRVLLGLVARRCWEEPDLEDFLAWRGATL